MPIKKKEIWNQFNSIGLEFNSLSINPKNPPQVRSKIDLNRVTKNYLIFRIENNFLIFDKDLSYYLEVVFEGISANFQIYALRQSKLYNIRKANLGKCWDLILRYW